MAVDLFQIVEFIRGIYLFRGLSTLELERVASQFTLQAYKPGQRIFSEGDAGDAFYIILGGRVISSHATENGEEIVGRLETGDFFGEEALLYERPRSTSATAEGNVELLSLDYAHFEQLLAVFPQIKPNLALTTESRQLSRTTQFDWVNPDEIIYQIRRKHQAYLGLSLVGPFLFGLASLIVILVVSGEWAIQWVWAIGAGISGLLFFIALAWGIWQWIDWGNDYYIVTNQRVVWIEQVVWLYDSRDEVPLSTVQSLDVTTSFLGRQLGFGNIIIRTYTGELVLRYVGEPYQLASVIEEYWRRVQRRSVQAESERLNTAIQEKMGLAQAAEPARTSAIPALPSLIRVPKVVKKQSFYEQYFANFLKMRFEEGNTITYRKYWPVLLGKTWMPSAAILGVFVILIVLLSADYFWNFRLLSPALFVPLLAFVIVFFLIPWWFYNYLDWRNDIYQVTDQYILDIERKPFGTEVKKSAPLGNILSLEHERLGVLGYLLNYGNVVINIGETKFLFFGIHDPARAQQDVFNRMYEFRRKKELQQAQQERKLIIEAIGVYHQNLVESQDKQNGQE